MPDAKKKPAPERKPDTPKKPKLLKIGEDAATVMRYLGDHPGRAWGGIKIAHDLQRKRSAVFLAVEECRVAGLVKTVAGGHPPHVHAMMTPAGQAWCEAHSPA